MAPGLNGTSPGGSGGGAAHSTGTVPKTKTRNESSHRRNPQLQLEQYQLQYQQQLQQHLQSSSQQTPVHFHPCSEVTPECVSNGSQRNATLINIPKNQALLHWQSSGEYQSSPRKNSATRDSVSDCYESGSDGSLLQDNRYGISYASPRRDGSLEINGILESQSASHLRFRMNGHDLGHGNSPSPSPSEGLSNGSPHSGGEVCRNSPSGRVVLPERNSSDSKKSNVSIGPERAQVATRLSQIQDYIKQTSTLMDTLRNSSNSGDGDKSQMESLSQVLDDLHDSEAKLQYLLAAFDKLNNEDDTKSCVNSSSSETPTFEVARSLSPTSEQGVSGATGKSKGGAVPKQNDSTPRNELKLKLKLEESMRKLQSLQDEQTALKHKRNQTQEQLQEAQWEQTLLMAMSAAYQSSSAADNSTEDVSGFNQEEQAKNSVPTNHPEREGHSCPPKGKNQVVNSEDHHCSPRKDAKVQDPHRKKQHTGVPSGDVIASYKELSAEDEVKEQASSEDSAVEDALDEYAEARAQVRLQGQIVRDKVAELNLLRAQLDHVKGLMTMAQKREATLCGHDSTSRTEPLPSQGPNDQAVNIQRQRCGPENNSAMPDQMTSKHSNAISSQQLLDVERSKLKRIHEILATVQEYRSSGLPIPEHLLNELSMEADSVATQSISRVHTPPHNASNDDAAVEADAEDDEPESAISWNMMHMSLSDSASYANELSQGLQQRAAELKAERDSLTATQRQLNGLFNQLQQEQHAQQANATNSGDACGSVSGNSVTSPHLESKDTNTTDDVLQRRMEMVHDLQNKWCQLQKDIASDTHERVTRMSTATAPGMDVTRDAMNAVAMHARAPCCAEEQGTVVDLGQTSPTRGIQQRQLQSQTLQPTPQDQMSPQHQQSPLAQQSPQHLQSHHQQLPRQQDIQEHMLHQMQPDLQMSSAPNTMKRHSSLPRAVWSSSMIVDESQASGVQRDSPLEDNPPIISMPTPSPNMYQQHTLQMQNRLAALSHSCQSLLSDTVEDANSAAILPAFPATNIPPPPPPGSGSRDREAYYQQLLAASQLQQQQMLLTAVNQCFHLLKLQQHELRNLNNTVHMLSSGSSHMVGPPGPEQWTSVGVGRVLSPPPPSGPPTLNNQVPPGNRTNNYWDNFRSYSRQNLLSTSAKSNEGLSHSPNPLFERSHNALRSSTSTPMPGPSSAPASVPTSAAVPALLPSAYTCLPGAGPSAGAIGGTVAGPVSGAGSGPSTGPIACQSVTLVDPAPPTLGATGPLHPSGVEFSGEGALTASLVHNISRNDKRNVDSHDGGAMLHRRLCNEREHHRPQEAFPNVPLDFEVPPMPILRIPMIRTLSELGAVSNDANYNETGPSTSVGDSLESSHSRNQLNNEGVPFSEMSCTVANNQNVGTFCSSRAREAHWSNRHNFNTSSTSAPMDSGSIVSGQGEVGLPLLHFNNVTSQGEATNVGSKCNSGAIKRTTTVSQNSSNHGMFTPSNYQRNFHASPTPSSHSRSNATSTTGTHNLTRNVTSMSFPSSSGDAEMNPKSSKYQTGQDCSRNFNATNRRAAAADDHQISSSPDGAASRTRSLGENEMVSNPFRRDGTLEYEDTPVVRGTISSQSAPSQNLSSLDGYSLGSGKNQLKESCFQIRKCPKYQSKSGPRDQISDAAAAAVAAVAAVASTESSHSNSQRSKSQGAKRRIKNNQESAESSQKLFEELRDAVYAEMTTLISANENRPYFLIQLFRDLQRISSDPLRQTTLQLIQQAVSRYQQAEEGRVNGQGDGAISSQEDETEVRDDWTHHLCTKDVKPIVQRQEDNYHSSSEGPGAASCNPTDKLMQFVLLEVSLILSLRTEEVCTVYLLEEVRDTLLRDLDTMKLIQTSPPGSNSQVTNTSRRGFSLRSQLDNMVEIFANKYQGRRIGEISDDLTSAIASILRSTVFSGMRWGDHLRHNSSEAEADSSKEVGASASEATSSVGVTSSPQLLHSSPHVLMSRVNRHNAIEIAVATESACNGDLAEADQSHITSHQSADAASPEDDTDHVADCDADSEADRDGAAEGSMSASGSESASAPLHVHVFQLSSAPELMDSEPEVEADQEEGETANCTSVDESDSRDETVDCAGAVGGSVIRREGNVVLDDHSCHRDGRQDHRSKPELDEEWSIDQDMTQDRERERELEQEREREREREQGLDRVPTRLSCDNDRDQESGEQNRSHHMAMPPTS